MKEKTISIFENYKNYNTYFTLLSNGEEIFDRIEVVLPEHIKLVTNKMGGTCFLIEEEVYPVNDFIIKYNIGKACFTAELPYRKYLFNLLLTKEYFINVSFNHIYNDDKYVIIKFFGRTISVPHHMGEKITFEVSNILGRDRQHPLWDKLYEEYLKGVE